MVLIFFLSYILKILNNTLEIKNLCLKTLVLLKFPKVFFFSFKKVVIEEKIWATTLTRQSSAFLLGSEGANQPTKADVILNQVGLTQRMKDWKLLYMTLAHPYIKVSGPRRLDCNNGENYPQHSCGIGLHTSAGGRSQGGSLGPCACYRHSTHRDIVVFTDGNRGRVTVVQLPKCPASRSDIGIDF